MLSISTVAGITTLSNAKQAWKAPLPMLFTDFGIETLVTFSLSTWLQFAHEPSFASGPPVMLAVPSEISKGTPASQPTAEKKKNEMKREGERNVQYDVASCKNQGNFFVKKMK